MFAGLSAFPHTPMDECGIDEAAFITHMLELVEDTQAAGGAALLAPVSYQPPCTDEVFDLYGSLGVVAAAAAQLGLTRQVNLARPLRPLDGAGGKPLEQTLTTLGSPR